MFRVQLEVEGCTSEPEQPLTYKPGTDPCQALSWAPSCVYHSWCSRQGLEESACFISTCRHCCAWGGSGRQPWPGAPCFLGLPHQQVECFLAGLEQEWRPDQDIEDK